MNYQFILIILFIILIPLNWCKATPADSLKPRIIVLTDISPSDVEPDDMESMIRLFVHADLFEIEGLVATTGWSSGGGNADWVNLIHDAIDGYEQDLPNLQKRSGQHSFNEDESRQQIGYWPSPDYLRSRTVVGSQVRGMEHIGEGNNSPGSKLIIKMADQQDERPLWILLWGGGNTLAQAIWQVQQEQTDQELKSFLHKLRAYAITDQDRSYKEGTPYEISSHQWMRRELKKDLFFIWDESAWRFQNGTGKSNWDQYVTHIQGHGNLGSMYPKYKYGVEGDTPSFLYVLPNGLNNPEHPGWGGWGGYFEWALGPDEETYAFTNHSEIEANSISSKYEKHFYQATFNDFAARMDWAAEGIGNRNPVVVINGDRGLNNINLSPESGTPIILDASGTSDPDGDDLRYSWHVLSAAGTYQQEVPLPGANAEQLTLQVPSDAAGKSFHIILEVADEGIPNLTSYRRIIVEPKKKHGQ